MEKIFFFLQTVLSSQIFSVNNQPFLQTFKIKCSMIEVLLSPIFCLNLTILNSFAEKKNFFFILFQIFSAKPGFSEYFLWTKFAGSTTFSISGNGTPRWGSAVRQSKVYRWGSVIQNIWILAKTSKEAKEKNVIFQTPSGGGGNTPTLLKKQSIFVFSYERVAVLDLSLAQLSPSLLLRFIHRYLFHIDILHSIT